MWPTSNFLKGIWATLGPYHILASLAPPLVPSTSSPLRTAVKYPPFLKSRCNFSVFGGQEHPGMARGTQGKARDGVPRAPWGAPGFPLGPPGPPCVPLAYKKQT